MSYVNAVFIGPKSHFLAVDSHRLLFVFCRIQIEAVNSIDRGLGLSPGRRSRRIYRHRRCHGSLGSKNRPAGHQQAENCRHYLGMLHMQDHLSRIILSFTLAILQYSIEMSLYGGNLFYIIHKIIGAKKTVHRVKPKCTVFFHRLNNTRSKYVNICQP